MLRQLSFRRVDRRDRFTRLIKPRFAVLYLEGVARSLNLSRYKGETLLGLL